MSCSAWWPPDRAALLLIWGRVPRTDVGLDAGISILACFPVAGLFHGHPAG